MRAGLNGHAAGDRLSDSLCLLAFIAPLRLALSGAKGVRRPGQLYQRAEFRSLVAIAAK